MKSIITHTLLGLCLLCASYASAQDARVYMNTARGTSIFQLHSINSTSIVAEDDLLENTKTRNQTYLGDYIYTFEGLFGRTAGLGVVVPVVHQFSFDEISEMVLIDEMGKGDASITLDHNFFGGMSMTKEVFNRTQPGIYSGIHFTFTFPTGEYDADQSSNIGSNRHTTKALYQLSFPFYDASAWLDIYAAAKIFGDNTDFEETSTLSQNDLYTLSSYFSKNITPHVWWELGAIYSSGGAIYIDGEENAPRQKTVQAAVGLSSSLWKEGSIRFLYSPTLYDNRDGFEKGYAFQVRFQQLF